MVKTKKESYTGEFHKIFLDVLQQPGFESIRIKGQDGFLRAVEERGEAQFYMIALETLESCKMAYRSARERLDEQGFNVEQSAINTLVDITKENLSLLKYLLLNRKSIDTLPEEDAQRAHFILSGNVLVQDFGDKVMGTKPSKKHKHSQNKKQDHDSRVFN